MANVWFVQRVGGVWKKVGEQPAFQRPLGDLVFRIDLGTHRRVQADNVPGPPDGTADEATSSTKVFVEVTGDDLTDTYFSGYFPGWYDSPYSAAEVRRRLGEAGAVAA